MNLAPLKEDLWNRGASFNQLAWIKINTSYLYSIPDIITTDYAMEEAAVVATRIKQNILYTEQCFSLAT